MFPIRPFTLDDCGGVAAIRRTCTPFDAQADNIRVWHENARSDPANTYDRMVAEDEQHRIVGVATAGHYHGMVAGIYNASVMVLPETRRHGLGQQLYNWVVNFVCEHKGTDLEGYVRGGEETAIAWVEKRGFTLRRQRTESVLDLKGWNSSRFAGHRERVAASGIRLVQAMGQEAAPYYRSIYELERLTSHDIPGSEHDEPPFESWVLQLQNTPTPFMTALALDGDRVVGYSNIDLPRMPGKEALTDYTGVLREYRGRGIALAVKLMTVEAAIAAGASAMRTNNDPDNPSMLRVNEKLGYVLVPGPRLYRKPL